MAKSIMIQGTCSNAGKSVIAAGLCRIFFEDGYKVAPFKAQNMALNSFVTADGLEMGRAQVTQAYACKIRPDVKMNPVLLKPGSETGSQVIVNGKPVGMMGFHNYIDIKKEIIPVIHESYNLLASENDIIVLEGAGSPAEINLKKNDVVNMNMAKFAESPVLIVGDIDRGGVFASFVGTMELFDKTEKDITKGFIINKFRGDIKLLQPGIEMLESKCSKKVYGVLPYFNDIKIPEEDSVEHKKNAGRGKYDKNIDINIAVIDLPYISNFTDFDSFLYESDLNLYYVSDADDLYNADIIIIPGSKNVIEDLLYLKEKGIYNTLKKLELKDKMIIGICGGYQMLGESILDPFGIESKIDRVEGLGFLKIRTKLEKNKILSQTKAVCTDTNHIVKGYEIHHGITKSSEKPFIVKDQNITVGSINPDKNIWGTYLHGIFENNEFRHYIINKTREKKGLNKINHWNKYNLDTELSKLADLMRKNIDIQGIYNIMGCR